MYGMTHGAQVSMNWSSYSCWMLSSTMPDCAAMTANSACSWPPCRGVAGAVDGGQQREKLVGVEAHDQSPMLPWVAGSSWSSSAPCGGTGPLAHSSAGAGPAAPLPLRPSASSRTAMTPAVC